MLATISACVSAIFWPSWGAKFIRNVCIRGLLYVMDPWQLWTIITFKYCAGKSLFNHPLLMVFNQQCFQKWDFWGNFTHCAMIIYVLVCFLGFRWCYLKVLIKSNVAKFQHSHRTLLALSRCAQKIVKLWSLAMVLHPCRKLVGHCRLQLPCSSLACKRRHHPLKAAKNDANA